MNSIESLQLRYPLPPGWNIVDSFRDTLDILSSGLQLRGWIARNELTGETVAASAADFRESPDARAYFELLERVSTLEALRSPTLAQAFSQSSDPQKWTYAKSNGIALHLSRGEAEQRALCELVERDRVIRSWTGWICPESAPTPTDHPLHELETYYRTESFLFPDPTEPQSQIQVAATFAFPKNSSVPFVYGFGAATGESPALDKAADECLQRLGFLWGEEWSEVMPDFSPTPDYHQEVYARAEGKEKILRWLEKGHRDFVTTQISPKKFGTHQFLDITPPSLAGRLHVIKACDEDRVKLTFGRVAPDCNPALPEELWIHPLL